MLTRRALLAGAGAAAALAALRGGTGRGEAAPLIDDGLRNPCLDSRLPEALARHEVVRAAWEGIDPARVWDMHVHLVGDGDSRQGPWLPADAWSLWHPIAYIRRLTLMNAACVTPGAVDRSYVDRLLGLIEAFPRGARCLLLSFDYHHDAEGRVVSARSSFHVPDHYTAALAQRFPHRFEWAASIHPYRPDAVNALAAAQSRGARAVKWLPNSMGIDPASPRCDAFYALLARIGMPLLTHAGHEGTVDAWGGGQDLGNPLRLRRALDHGVRVIVAHCASFGKGVDLDAGPNGPRVGNFALFARLMDDARYARLVHGDISALVQRNRAAVALAILLARDEWHGRLLWGSDYPLPGVMPLINVHAIADMGLLDPREVPVLIEIRRHNPLLFDFVLKRRLAAGGRRFAAEVFETRGYFGAA
jgi:predicted TIM-barrel fold metal-dependent hydrolase